MSRMRFTRNILVGCGALLLAACGTAPQQPAPIETPKPEAPVTIEKPEPPPMAPQPPAQPEQPNVESAYRALLKRADKAADKGNYNEALALLERAQRIDPDSGEIYLALAQTYLAKGDLALSQATAERGLLYCESSQQCRSLRRLTD